MSTIYLCIVIFLLCLAVFDLFVGVSNDAVNFLQSAIGAKVAASLLTPTKRSNTARQSRKITMQR